MSPVRWVYFIEKYRSVTNIAGTVLVGWIASLIVSQFIGLFLPDSSAAIPPPAYNPNLDPANGLADTKMLEFYMPICERNIFDSQKRSPCTQEVTDAPGQGKPVDMEAAPVKSDLAATLLGTMVSTNPNYSFATIQPKTGKDSAPYYIDQMIMDEGRIYSIVRNKVFFIRNGHREFLEVENLPNIFMSPAEPGPAASGGVKLDGDKAIVSRSMVDSTLGDLNQVIQQARMVPNFSNGKVDGFKIFAIRPGSIFQELGLKNGDVIQRINGTEINSVEKAIPMLQLARNDSQISIDLVRGGTKKSLTIDIR
jgi:general secretion pathway protein C